MEVPKVLHMNGGDGEMSYYHNSTLQTHVILKVRPTLVKSIAQVCENNTTECFTIAELGCSLGPNTLLPLWEMIEAIDSTCARLNKKPPIMQAFLNDLPGTDFNTIFGSLVPEFQVKLMEKNKNRTPETCLIGAMPGSFYTTLFPKNSLHFVHSSCGLHWCSQVPKGLVTEDGIPLNKGNICLAKTSPPIVHKLYLEQFNKDFTTFLKLRSEEMICGGAMVLTFHVKNSKNPNNKFSIELLQLTGESLQDMVNEGIIAQSSLDSYNIPLYAPPVDEVLKVIENDGSFSVREHDEFEVRWDVNFDPEGKKELEERGKYVAKIVRAVAESMIASHFGEAIIDDLFYRFSLKACSWIEKGLNFTNFLVISLIKKGLMPS